MRELIKMGDRFYCENYGVYLTVDGVDQSPHILHCVEEEVNDVGDLIVIGTGLYTEGELSSARWKKVVA